MRKTLLALAVLCVYALTMLIAGDGDLDTSFDSDGKVTTAIGSANDRARDIIQQSDGKLVVVGETNNGSNDDIAIVRYNSDGSLDTGFDSDGIATKAVGSGYDKAYAVLQQSDGKLVVAGYYESASTNNDVVLLRYDSDGSLDTGFDSDGIVTTNIITSGESYSTDFCKAVMQQSDDKLVIVGHCYVSVEMAPGAGNIRQGEDEYYFFAARYNTDGSLDTGFDSDGIATQQISTAGMDVTDGLIQSDGKIVGVGTDTDNYLALLFRYNTNGSLDTGFDSDGYATPSMITGSEYLYGVAQQSSGKLVVGGYISSGGYDFMVARFNTNGSLDTGFDSDGVATASFTSGILEGGYCFIQQGDGKLVVAGWYSSGNEDFAVVCFNSDGSVDTDFGSSGLASVAISSNSDVAFGITQQSAGGVDGKLVVAGKSNNGSNDDFAVIRLDQTDSSLPIELASFDASLDGNAVKLTWFTESELENQGFIVSRQTGRSGPWEELASFTTHRGLSGQGSTTRAHRYEFKDTQVRDGQTYTYMLSDVNFRNIRTDHRDHITTITYMATRDRIAPEAFNVRSLYPNPFNPIITIQYDLLEPTDVHFNVYDMNGRLMHSHDQSDHPVGHSFQLSWDGTDLLNNLAPAGIYVLKLEAGNIKMVRKVTLVR